MVKRRSKLQKEHWERVRVLNRRYQKPDSDEEGPTVEEGAHPEVESSYTVKMTNFGKNKIEVLKVVRRLLKLGVKEANELVENIPAVLGKEMNKADAEELIKVVKEAGAELEITYLLS
eukprot:775253_1